MSEAAPQAGLFPIPDPPHEESAPAAAVERESPVRNLRRKYLINKINYLNFAGLPMDACFTHASGGTARVLKVYPEPCTGSTLDCVWEPAEEIPGSEYELTSLRFVEEGQEIRILPESAQFGPRGLTAELPKSAGLSGPARAIRYRPDGIDACLLQNGVRIPGELLDFSSEDFRLSVDSGENEPADWINPSLSLTLMLERQGKLLYSADCSISAEEAAGRNRRLSVRPTQPNIPRFPAKEYRSSRHLMDLCPMLQFTHPLTGAPSSFRITELSGTGFAVREPAHDSRLIPGLIIPEAKMVFADRKSIHMSLQLIYRREASEEGYVRCGIAILDIAPEEHLSILALLHQDNHPDAYLSSTISIDDLWRFFFTSGFIYPRKYQYLHSYKDSLKKTYEKLYNGDSDIARHFVVQRDNAILGHLSMVRFYDKTWLIHHHASAVTGGGSAGLRVLQQIGHYANESHRFRRMNLKFLMCYYRPENKFPAKVFGGLAPFVGDPQLCSVDPCALFHVRSGSQAGDALPALFTLDPMNGEDYAQLAASYGRFSGGMMLEAMNLPPFGGLEEGNRAVEESFRELGIERSVRSRALRKNGRLVAALILNSADPGINLSELTNSISMIVLDSESLSSDIVQTVCGELAGKFATPSVPVLMYPQETADILSIPVDRVYHLWVMRMTISDQYFRHLNGYLRNVES
jgi:hypothetical protein